VSLEHSWIGKVNLRNQILLLLFSLSLLLLSRLLHGELFLAFLLRLRYELSLKYRFLLSHGLLFGLWFHLHGLSRCVNSLLFGLSKL
jgi:hypothetical protein